MSEPISTEISIGGKIRAELVPGLCNAIVEEGGSLEWGDAWFMPETAEDLLRRLRNLQQLVHEAMPPLVPPLEPFEIVE